MSEYHVNDEVYIITLKCISDTENCCDDCTRCEYNNYKYVGLRARILKVDLCEYNEYVYGCYIYGTSSLCEPYPLALLTERHIFRYFSDAAKKCHELNNKQKS